MPFQLVTQEFNEKIARLLTDDGVYLINLIDTYDNGRFLGAVVGTVQQTFPHVYVLTSEIGLPSLRDTFVVVATKRPIDPRRSSREHNKHLKFWLLNESDMDYLQDQAGRLVLTDDYAPVEHMLTSGGAAERRGDPGPPVPAGSDGPPGRRPDTSRAFGSTGEAVSLNPSMALKAYNEIGLMHVAQNRPEEAVAAFQEAIKAQREAGGKQTAVASVHMNLGVLLDRMKKPKESREQFAKAAEWFRIELDENPGSVVAWDRLGDTVAMMGEFKEASDAFEKALALEPTNPSHYEKLSRALEHQKRYDEAIVVVKKTHPTHAGAGQPRNGHATEPVRRVPRIPEGQAGAIAYCGVSVVFVNTRDMVSP